MSHQGFDQSYDQGYNQNQGYANQGFQDDYQQFQPQPEYQQFQPQAPQQPPQQAQATPQQACFDRFSQFSILYVNNSGKTTLVRISPRNGAAISADERNGSNGHEHGTAVFEWAN